MPYYIYNPDREFTKEEIKVKDMGYPFVSTTVLVPGKGLGDHRHHSQNTHLIVKGSLGIGHTTKYGSGAPDRIDEDTGVPSWWRFRNVLKCGKDYELKVPANVDYMSENAGPDGCVFVEGHKALSPTSATRFWRFETFVKVEPGYPGAFFVEPEEDDKPFYVKPEKLTKKDVGLEDIMSHLNIGTNTNTKPKRKN